jgi:hypothetical protein
VLPVLTIALAALPDCPAPDAVETKLQALRSPGAAAPRYTLEVVKTGASLLLSARDLNGGLWVQRELPAAAPCAELEDAAAVVLLAWEAQLMPGEVPVPDVPVVEQGVEAPHAEPASVAVRVSAAGQAWLSSASPAWGATGAVELHGRWLGVELSVMGQGRRELPLSTGRAMWSRFSVSVGPVATVRVLEGLDVSFGAALIGGPFWVTGRGFDQDASVLDWDLGASAQVKVLLPSFWKLRPYVAAGGVLWARRHIVEARTPDAARVIPFLEASPTLGLVFTP